VAQPGFGAGNRTNITNVGAGSNLVYDPAFAAALDIRRNIDPTLNLGGTGGLTVPASLRPQIPGEFTTTDLGEADMVRPMFNSQLERILQQTIPEAIKEGPVARIATGIGNFFGNLFAEGRDFAKDATAGIDVPSLKEISEGFTNFMNRFRPQGIDTSMNVGTEADLMLGDTFPEVYRGGKGTVSVPDALYSGQNTFGSMPRNTGIASVRPQQMQDVDRNVADALQLVPSEFQDVPTDLGSSIRIAPGSGADRFKFTTSTGANLPGLNQLGNVFDMLDARDLEKEIGNLTGEERDFLAGRRNRIVGTPSRFVTTTPNFSVPGFRSKSMSEKEAEEIKRRLGVS